MESDDDDPVAAGLLLARSWQATMVLGAVTLILGFIVRFRRAVNTAEQVHHPARMSPGVT